MAARSDIATIKDRFHGRKCCSACLQFGRKDAKNFLSYDFGEDEFVLRKDELQEVRTKPTRDECRDEYVGIQAYSSHEISLNTSSSV